LAIADPELDIGRIPGIGALEVRLDAEELGVPVARRDHVVGPEVDRRHATEKVLARHRPTPYSAVIHGSMILDQTPRTTSPGNVHPASRVIKRGRNPVAMERVPSGRAGTRNRGRAPGPPAGPW